MGRATFYMMTAKKTWQRLSKSQRTLKLKKLRIRKELGDMYNSYMNTELANKKGIAPLQSLLDTISNAENMLQLSKVFGELYV